MADMPVEVVRSRRRHKTIQAYVQDGRLRVMIPAHFTPVQEAEAVEKMRDKLSRRLNSTTIDLFTRARALAKRYDLPEPETIEWSGRQVRRWGSCTPGNRHIRISDRLGSVPGWVLDSVIVHELAHLMVPGHGANFDLLVGRYPMTERATGYLMAIGEGDTMPSIRT